MMKTVNWIFGITLILVGIALIVDHIFIRSHLGPTDDEGIHGLMLMGIGLVLLNQARQS